MNPSRPSLPRPFHPPSEPSSISPLRRVDADIEFQAGLADVTLRFHWLHPGPHVLHLLHPFPLPAQAVLYHSECSVHPRAFSTRRVTAAAARTLRLSPQTRGRTCVQVRRLHPTRADLSIDFLPPFCLLDVRVSFLIPVEYQGAVAEFILPFCPPVLPGLIPPPSTIPHPYPHPPRLPATHPQAPHLNFHGRLLDPSHSCQLLESPSHPLLVLNQHQEQTFALARQPCHPQADLVLRWRNSDPRPGHARAWSDGREPFAHALVHLATPRPASPSSPPATRPFHVLIDASGSMRGRPWSQACRTVRARLAQLPPATPVSVAVFHASLIWMLPPSRTAQEAATDGTWFGRLERFLPRGFGSPEVALSSWIQTLVSLKTQPPGHLEWLTDGEFLPPRASLAHVLQDTPFSLNCLLFGGHPGGGCSASWPEHPRLHRQVMASYDPPETWALHHPALPPDPILTHLQLSRPWLPITSLPSALRTGEVHSLLVTGPSHLASLKLHARNLQGKRQILPITVSTTVIPAISLLAQAIAHARQTLPPISHAGDLSAALDADPVPLFPNLVDIGFLPGPPLSGTPRSMVQPALEPQTLTDRNSPYPPLPPLDPLRESSALTLPCLPGRRITSTSRHPYRRRNRTPHFLPVPSDSKMSAP